jgi:DNA helicase-2/ATP-dependent DNA helicase PcrA
LLRSYNDILIKYQKKFQYVLIDEYQDTNPVQYQITKLLAARNENICVVGDDSQSIYSFRGATIKNILKFQEDYDDVTVVKLEQNYRSTQMIVDAANKIILNNKEQIQKKLWTENSAGDKIKVVRTMTENEEAKFVGDSIQEQKLRYHFSNKDFAILYRTNAQSRAFEEVLRRHGIAYKIYGGVSFYQRKEVKDFLAYLRLVMNTRDEEALKRIINFPVRGIGKTTIERSIIIAREKNIPVFEVIKNAGEYGFKNATLKQLQDFVTLIEYFKAIEKEKNAYEIAFLIGKESKLVKEYFDDKSSEGLAKYQNVEELLNSIKEWVESPDNEEGEVVDKSLGAFLQKVTLLTDADKDKENADVVKLMTIHAAKGLEFACVFVAGVEENIFPNGFVINSQEDLEEERRLFYVAVTRAKQRLWLSYANARYRFGDLVQNAPSRFLDEMPEEYLDKSYAGGGARNQSFSNMGSAFERMNRGFGYNNDYNDVQQAEKRYGSTPKQSSSASNKTPGYITPPARTQVKEHIPSDNFVASDTSNLQEGQKVEHQKFGYGIVTKTEGSAHNPVATVKFELNGEKKIMLNYAKLRIVE